jgi:hypothetical protein
MEENFVSGAPLTLATAKEKSADLLRNDVDKRIVKLRPMATPIDQISRYAETRSCHSMTVDYYAVDTKPTETTVAKAEEDGTGDSTLKLTLADAGIVEVSDLMLINPGAANQMLVYVMSKDDATKLVTVRVVSGSVDEAEDLSSAKVLRMSRAAAELDMQTAQFEALPRKESNNCQIFKAQIEQSTLMRAANKEVGWTFSDQEEVAVYDMRLGMEKSFLFGTKARFMDPVKKSEIFLTGGIWNQAGKSATYPAGKLTSEAWLKVMATAFTGHAGSARKILVAGTELIEALSLLDGGQQRVMLPHNVVTRWGLDFQEMHSKFGTLYVIHSEVLDACGHAADGLIIDPEFLTKYVHVPFGATTLDLRKSGQRNTEAVVLTEVSCLVLRYPDAHVRVIAA